MRQGKRAQVSYTPTCFGHGVPTSGRTCQIEVSCSVTEYNCTSVYYQTLRKIPSIPQSHLCLP